MIKRVYLEITNACNLDCPFCTYDKGQSFMSLYDIKDCLKQIKEVCDYVYLHVLGEPTLHPYFNEIMDYCDELKLNVQLVTNGTLLYKYKDILSHPSLRKLSISLHSINNIDIESKYFDTINSLISTNSNTHIELRFYDINNLDTKLNDYLKYLKTSYEFKDTPKDNSYKIKDNVYVYYAELFDWPSINDEFVTDIGKCHGAIDQVAILHNLKVTVCCLDPKGLNQIGDLKKNTLLDILSSNSYKEVINNFKNNKLTFDLCKKCKYHLRFK